MGGACEAEGVVTANCKKSAEAVVPVSIGEGPNYSSAKVCYFFQRIKQLFQSFY